MPAAAAKIEQPDSDDASSATVATLPVLARSSGLRRSAYPALVARMVEPIAPDFFGFAAGVLKRRTGVGVNELDRVFARWDALAAEHRVEKIKAIGDAYMAASGIPHPRDDHAEAIADLALQMGPELKRLAADTRHELQARIGIDSGSVVAGVIGRSKFIYDLWGDTVNTASRMESHGEADTIQVTERTYQALKERYELHPRGTIEVKGKGIMTTYLLVARRGDGETTARRNLPVKLRSPGPSR